MAQNCLLQNSLFCFIPSSSIILQVAPEHPGRKCILPAPSSLDTKKKRWHRVEDTSFDRVISDRRDFPSAFFLSRKYSAEVGLIFSGAFCHFLCHLEKLAHRVKGQSIVWIDRAASFNDLIDAYSLVFRFNVASNMGQRLSVRVDVAFVVIISATYHLGCFEWHRSSICAEPVDYS